MAGCLLSHHHSSQRAGDSSVLAWRNDDFSDFRRLLRLFGFWVLDFGHTSKEFAKEKTVRVRVAFCCGLLGALDAWAAGRCISLIHDCFWDGHSWVGFGFDLGTSAKFEERVPA